MPKVLVTDTYLTNIGNAIRGKNGLTTQYKPSEMSSAIESLSTGTDAKEIYFKYTEADVGVMTVIIPDGCFVWQDVIDMNCGFASYNNRVYICNRSSGYYVSTEEDGTAIKPSDSFSYETTYYIV